MNPAQIVPRGGTRPRPPSELRSRILREHGQAIAEECVLKIYRFWPELLDRYGERGRRLAAEDNLWHLDFLDASVTLGAPEHFEEYGDWLVAFFGPRGLEPRHVAGAFGLLAEGLARVESPPELQEHRQALLDTLSRARVHILARASCRPTPNLIEDGPSLSGSILASE